MFRIRRVPAALDKFFDPRRPHWRWHHGTYFRLLVLAIAVMWGRRNVANLYRYVEAAHHRTRFNNCCLVQRWDPKAALRQQAQTLLHSGPPGTGETISVLLDDSKKAQRGKVMDAVAKMEEPTLTAYIRGHPYVCAIWVFRQHVIPCGIRLYVKQESCRTLALPFRKPTELAAHLIREFQAPAGVKVMVLFATSDLCHTVVKACRDQGVHFASTLKSHRRLFTRGWQLKAGRYGKHLFRRRRTEPLVLVKPQGKGRDRSVEAGWLPVSHLGVLPGVCSRTGAARKILGLVTDDPELSAAGLIRTSGRRGDIEPWLKDVKPRLGLGHYQHRPSRAAVIPRHLVGFASALLTPLRMERHGAQGQQTHRKAADLSTAAAQEQLRGLLWEDLLTYLKEDGHGQSVLEELELLRVA